jgi:hypothetical protein
MKTLNAIGPFEYKINHIFQDDFNKSFEALKLVFEQRKKCAELILSTDFDILQMRDAKAFIELCDNEIKKAFYL